MSMKSEYMVFFSGGEWYNELPPAEIKKIAAHAKAWLDSLSAQGKVKDGRGLARTGVTIAGKTGRVILDGPFAESKEAVGGFLVLEVENLEEAVEIARSNPTIAYGTTMEIRPIHNECPLDRLAREAEEQLAAVAA